MSDDHDDHKAGDDKASGAARERRLAEALRANLKRRKVQERERAGVATTETEPGAPNPATTPPKPR